MIQSIGDIEFEMSEIQELGNGYCCAANRWENHLLIIGFYPW